jgi:hypothetical protein
LKRGAGPAQYVNDQELQGLGKTILEVTRDGDEPLLRVKLSDLWIGLIYQGIAVPEEKLLLLSHTVASLVGFDGAADRIIPTLKKLALRTYEISDILAGISLAELADELIGKLQDQSQCFWNFLPPVRHPVLSDA